MIHQLTSWEDNGYHDSYFYVSIWDDVKREVRAVQEWSTAGAGKAGVDKVGLPITDRAALADAIKWLAAHIYGVIRAAEYRDILEPSTVENGVIVRLLRNVKHKGAVIAEGVTGRVFWSQAYGQFYKNGYNRPGRENIRLGIHLLDGSTVFVALKACRLDREPLSDEELTIRAWDLAQECQFSQSTGEKFAWDSTNFAIALYKQAAVQIAA